MQFTIEEIEAMDEAQVRGAIIDVLMNDQNNWRDMIITLAKTHPKLIIGIGTSLTQNNLPEMDGLIRRGEKIKAIKYVRSETGMGLKEAKELVDERCSLLAGTTR